MTERGQEWQDSHRREGTSTQKDAGAGKARGSNGKGVVKAKAGLSQATGGRGRRAK